MTAGLKEQTLARTVERELAKLGIASTVAGEGVHWRVEVAAGSRGITVACFWYEADVHALMLGMNPANARASLRERAEPYEGLELAVELLVDGREVADGRTRTIEPFLACARAWLAGASVVDLVAIAPFIDEQPRAMRALAARFDPAIRWTSATVRRTSCGPTARASACVA